MSTIEKVRIVVIGDSGVGKTSLVHLICYGKPIMRPCWTIGCSVEVKLHDYQAVTPYEKAYFIELWDVGGWSAHASSRSVFYQSINGIMLVHDLTNRKSHENLSKWIKEFKNIGHAKQNLDKFDCENELEQLIELPTITFGTKTDLCSSNNILPNLTTNEIHIDCTQAKHLAAGTGNAVQLARFFDKVIQYKNQKDIPILDKRKQGNKSF